MTIFYIIIITLLVTDLGVFHKKNHVISAKTSLISTAVYFLIGMLFGVYVWFQHGNIAGQQYFTGFIIEKILSLDNIFLILIIFSSLNIPIKYQHKVLFWGILGVIFLRGVLIYLGSEMIQKYEWVMLIFGVILIFTGIKMFFIDDTHSDFSKNKFILFLRKHLRITEKLDDNKFFTFQKINQKKKLFLTPLFLALVAVEFCDLIFALDSIPAIFLITTDPYIVYTSNIFAILGLRAVYFAIASVIARFKYVKYSLSILLVFIGSKIFIHQIFHIEITSLVSLFITIFLIASGILYSLYKTSDYNNSSLNKKIH